MSRKSLISPHAPSRSPRMIGRHSDKISQSLSNSEKQLRVAEKKRARRGAVRLEASSRGHIERAPDLDRLQQMLYQAGVHADDCQSQIISDGACTCGADDARIYADEELRCDPEAEVTHQGPDQ